MDYKKKYEEANDKVAARFGTNVAKEIFADLYESEDERIRKELIGMVKFHCADEYLDRYLNWLEKQGEKQDYNPYKSTIESISAMVEKYANGDLKDFYDNIKVKCKDAMEYDNTWNKKQGEQKSADKVESKFKVGDWVVQKNGSEFFNEKLFAQVTNIDNKGRIWFTHGTWSKEEYIRLWTIQDAKDGDVLADGDSITIFRKIGNDIWNDVIDFHVCYNSRLDKITIQKDNSHCGTIKSKIIHPATKEQRDLLFAKMKEAGYEWDADKRELRKIDDYCKEHCKGYKETGKCYADGECKAKKEAEQKPAWSDEDERILTNLIHYFNSDDALLYQEKQIIDWLKSFKDRVQPHWKPTEEQLMALRDAIDNNEMESLYNDLKKL
jgi:hypothetical protein